MIFRYRIQVSNKERNRKCGKGIEYGRFSLNACYESVVFEVEILKLKCI